jgi:predicted phosphodiesterase
MRFEEFLGSFQSLIAASPSENLEPGGRYVVMSDLHMGDGGSRDDLVHNRRLLRSALRDWYLERGYTLILDGDIEELHKFDLASIGRAWEPLYKIFDEFQGRGALRKIVGNHDLALLKEEGYPYPLIHGLSLLYGERRLFIFHGHQASRFFVKYNYLSDFIVRYLARPLHIKNTSISQDSHQRFKNERRIYKASKRLGLVSIAGHTHRPLFESLSKYDSLRYSMESLIRDYPRAGEAERERIADMVSVYRGEFEALKRRDRQYGLSRGLYEERDFVIPCLFNTGCATGGSGITAIEVERGWPGPGRPAESSISLVHWTEASVAKPYIEREALFRDRLEGSPYARYVLGRDSIDSLFARIELLALPMEAEVAV